MPAPEGKTKFRFAFVVVGICALTVIGCYFYSVWTASQEEKALLPRLAADQIIKALRTYHHQVGKFPASFVELEERVWKHATPPKFYEEGRSISMHNYYYTYYFIDPGVCALWAIPVNRRREEASTYFLTISPQAMRRWKGAALSVDDIQRSRQAGH